MSKRNIFWIVLATVVVILALAAGGYALYRYGYMRGMAAETGTGCMTFFADHMRGMIGERTRLDVGEGMMPLRQYGGFMTTSSRFSHMPFSWGRGLIGLLLGGGVLALAVYGVISLVRRNHTSVEEVETKKKK